MQDEQEMGRKVDICRLEPVLLARTDQHMQGLQGNAEEGLEIT